VSVSAVVGVAGPDGEGAVDLLSGDGGGEFMGQRDAAEGDGAVGAGQRGGGPAVRRTDGEDQLLGARILQGTDGGGELRRADLLAPAVRQQECGPGAGGGAGQELKQVRFGGDDPELAGDVAPDTSGEAQRTAPMANPAAGR
jgi:hypothetical protein